MKLKSTHFACRANNTDYMHSHMQYDLKYKSSDAKSPYADGDKD